MRILVADDHLESRDYLRRLMVDRGDSVLEAATGEEALEIARRECPDLVLSDVLMPIMDGFELLQQLRLDPATRSIPVILLSGAYHEDASQTLAAAGGASALLTKPYRKTELLAAIDAATRDATAHSVAPEFEREHMRVLMDKLSEKTTEAERAGETLRQSESQMQAMFESALDAMLVADDEGRSLMANRAACQLTGYSCDELLKLKVDDLTRESWGALVAMGDHSGEMTLLRKDGSSVPTEYSMVANFAPELSLCVLRDISTRKAAEEALVKSRDSAVALLNDFPGLIWRSGVDGKCDYFNRTWLEFTGRTFEQELGDGWLESVHPEDRESAMGGYLDAFHAQRPFVLEYRLRRHDGEYRHIVDFGSPYFGLDGRFAGFLGSCYDVTERERAKERVRKSESLLAEAESLAHIGSWEWDITNDTVRWSDELYRIMGLKPQECPVSYGDFLNCVHPEDRDYVHRIVQKALQERTGLDYELRIVRPDSSVRILYSRSGVVLNEKGRPIRMFGTAQDITERKQAGEALRKSEERFRQIAECINEVFWIKDMATGRTEYVSPGYERIWKRSLAELEQSPNAWIEAVYPDDYERVRRVWESPAPGHLIYRIVWPDGAIRWIQDRASAVYDDTGHPVRILGVAEDITDLKQAEQTVRALLGISEKLNSTLDVEMLMEILAREAIELVGATSGWAGLHTAEGIVANRCLKNGKLLPFRRVWPTGDGLPGWTLVHKRPYLTNDAARDPQIVPEVRERLGFRRAMNVPILDLRGEVLGSFQIHDKIDGSDFTPADMEKLVSVAQAASIALQNALAYQKVQQKEAELRELSGRLLQLQDEEHRRIARELHDSTAQELVAVGMNLGKAQTLVGEKDPQLANLIADSLAIIENAGREIRTISHLLHPPLLETLGLSGALQHYAGGFSQRSGIEVALDIEPDVGRLPNEVETTLFRIVQEALGNVHRHSGSPSVEIKLRRRENELVLEVCDAGRGIGQLTDQKAETSMPLGVGIAGMRERVRQLGGRLELESSGAGTTVRAILRATVENLPAGEQLRSETGKNRVFSK